MKIIGIGGTNGSGKDTLSQILADDYGWLFVSASEDLLIPELKNRGEVVERETMRALSAEWRRDFGLGALIDKATEKFDPKKYKGLVISSLRNYGEADRIHELGGQVVWTDADPRVRYERIFSRGQGDKDKKAYEEFLAEEQAEKEHLGDEATLNWQGVKDRADIFLTNNSNNIADFRKAVVRALDLKA